MPDLSIITVCHKGWDRLNKCLEALNTFSGINVRAEVIVVNNKSDDDTIHKIEEQFSKFRFIYNTVNGGFANGCNLGVKIAKGEYILFLNPDTVAAETEIEKLFNTAKQNPEYTIVSCRQLNENGKESISYGPFPSIFNLTGFQRAIFGHLTPAARRQTPDAGRRTPHTANHIPDISFPDWVSGSVMLIRHDTLKNLSGFDEDFWMYFEDVDLCRRIRNNRGEIAFCWNISIEHNHGGSSRVNLKTTSLTKTEVHISRHVYISKHKSGIERIIIQIFLVINNLISGGIMALFGVIFFFVPKIFSRTIIYFRLISYYAGSLFRLSWISPRSVNSLKK